MQSDHCHIKEKLNNKQLEPSPYRIRSNNRNNTDRTLKNCRYEDQIGIFKNEIKKRIQTSTVFMVGNGAIGSEFLKSFGMMGFCSDKNSKFTATDNDNINI